MTLIVCLDINNGIRFNNRRQSRDRMVIGDIFKNKVANVWILEESLELFEDYFDKSLNDNIEYSEEELKDILVDDTWYEKIKDNDCCFIEKNISNNLMNMFEQIIVYRWDKVYPWDEVFEIDESVYGLEEIYEIKGYSHDVIKKEIYRAI